MDLDLTQARNLLLAGTVPFPSLFPAIGVVQITEGDLIVSRDGKIKTTRLVISRHDQDGQVGSRLMQQSDVAGIFVPGAKDEHGVFQMSQAQCVDDFDEGEWFLDEDVNSTEIRSRLNLTDDIDISTARSVLRGIVFVPEDRGTVYTVEVSLRAGDDCLELHRTRSCCRPCCCCCCCRP